MSNKNISLKDLQNAVNLVFDSYDTDRNGYLDCQEVSFLINDALKHMNQKKKVSPEEVEKFVTSIDKNNDKYISQTELL